MTRPVLFCVIQTGARANGGVRSISEVMARLVRHRPVVLTNLDSDATREWRAQGIEVHVEPEGASAGLRQAPIAYARAYARYHRRVRELLARSGARVVHANDPLAFQLALSAAKLGGARIILNLRDTLDPGRRSPRLKFAALFGLADHVLYLSSDMAERWRAVAPNATRSYGVTYSVVDSGRFAARPVEPESDPIVLVSGVFRPKKGQLEFIRKVVPALAREGVPTWFAGDFDPETRAYDKACAAAAAPYGEALRFLGFRSDLPALLAQARVLAVPSLHEGLMRGMIEAMACARPVVSFDVCSAREVLEEQAGGAGIVVQADDYAGMTEAILGYCRDPAAASQAGSKGHSAAGRLFAPDEVVERYEQAYDALEARS